MEAPVVTLTHQVNMTDVDLVQINFAKYFLWMDQAAGALLRACGHPLSKLISSGYATPVVSVSCDYLRPVGLDDVFRTRSAVTSVGRSSYVVTHRFEDNHGLFAIGRATHVWVRTTPQHISEPAPQWIHDALVQDFDEPAVRARVE